MFGDFWREGRLYRRALKRSVLILWAAFIGVSALMVLLGYIFKDAAYAVTQFFTEFVTDSGIMDEGGDISALGLFLNNSRAALFCILYGVVPFLFLPAFIIGFNALIVGFVLAATTAFSGGSLLLMSLAGILPHGIFEITALVIGASAGLILCRELCKCIMGKPRMLPLWRLMLHLLFTYLAAVLPLMAVAALVEAYVTPLLLGLVM